MYFPYFHSFITYFILAISWSNFAQIQWSWKFFNSQDDELFKNVQDFRIWVKFDRVIAKNEVHAFFWNTLYSGWLSILHVGKGEFDSEKLIEVFRDYFLTFGVCEEISSDTASQYMSSKFQKFLQQYGIRHRQSSAYFAHSNSKWVFTSTFPQYIYAQIQIV